MVIKYLAPEKQFPPQILALKQTNMVNGVFENITLEGVVIANTFEEYHINDEDENIEVPESELPRPLILPDGREKWLLLLAQFAPSAAAGDGGRVLGVAMDITGQKQAEVRLSTIARELQHRAKNSLTVVQALASQSFRGDRDLEESLAAFSQRLRALANTADVTSRDWTSADFRDLVIRATNPYRDSSSDPFELSGPPVLLPSKHITAVGMALHELSTNAVKYGALGTAGGRVRLSWTAEAEQLTIKWKESGGPPVRPPTGRGFGTRLLQAGLLGRDEGSVALDFAADGVECTIRVKLHVEPDNPTAAVS